MNKTVQLGYQIVYKELLLRLNYPVNTVASLIGSAVIFFGVLYGGNTVVGGSFTQNLPAIAVGLGLWVIASTAYQNLSKKLSREASWGTLEQMYMSPIGFGRVTILTAVAGMVDSFLRNGLIFMVVVAISGPTLDLTLLGDPISILIIATLGVISILGLGLVFGGAAIRFKRIDNAIMFMTLMFPIFIAAPVTQYQLLKFLPLAQSSYMLQEIMTEGGSLLKFSTSDIFLLFVVAVGYFAAGYYILSFFTDSARRNGVMGHY